MNFLVAFLLGTGRCFNVVHVLHVAMTLSIGAQRFWCPAKSIPARAFGSESCMFVVGLCVRG